MQKGFTLVELAIVLVIIGLLVSGILAGQELIEQSKIRAQIKQLAEFDTGKSTFQTKYNALPGDVKNIYGNLFFNCPSYSPATVMDGRISSQVAGNIPILDTYCEPYAFFYDLSQAGLLASIILGAGGIWNIGEHYPKLKLSEGGITAGSNSDGYLYYFLGISENNTANVTLLSTISAKGVMTPAQANALDEKLDDGNPSTGTVKAVRNSFATDSTLNDCLGATNSVYNLSSTDMKCRLIIKAK